MTDPTSVDVVGRISRLCDLGRWADAAREAGSYLQTSPDDVRALCLLAQARLGLQDATGALAAAQAAMTAEPSSEWPLRLASLASRALGRHADAVQLARAAVEAGPFLAQAHVALARAEVARARDLEAARRAADQALRLAPLMVEAHLAVGAVAFAQQRFDDAEAACREALRIDPQSSAAHNDLTRVALRRQRFAGSSRLAAAAGGFATALRADPNAQASRRNLDLVMHIFLRRLSYFVLLAAYIGSRLVTANGVSRGALWVPVVALVVPGVFAVRFVGGLTAPLRNHLKQTLRGRTYGLPAAALGVACVLLALGAAAPPTEAVAFWTAFLLALGARLGLYHRSPRWGGPPPGK